MRAPKELSDNKVAATERCDKTIDAFLNDTVKRKAGRPPKRVKMARMQFCIEPAVEAQLHQEAAALELDVSDYIRRVIKGEVKR